jgi:hypothetical protein
MGKEIIGGIFESSTSTGNPFGSTSTGNAASTCMYKEIEGIGEP